MPSSSGSTRRSTSVTPAFASATRPGSPTLRSDGIKNVDFSLFKNNRFNDGKWNAQIRIEAFNVLNRTRFNAPNTAVDSSAFGTINGASGGRQVQIGAQADVLIDFRHERTNEGRAPTGGRPFA